MTELIENATSTEIITNYLETLDYLVLLKLHKYFFWADKKLHSVFYIEDKDQINEDLLVDFKDEDEKKYIKVQNLASKK
jgi:predicted nucleic acid-binding protein